MEEMNQNHSQENPPPQAEEHKPALAAGEKVFAVVLLLTGLGGPLAWHWSCGPG